MRRRLNPSTRVDATHVVGLDLSLRAAAACALPIRWDHDLSKVRMMVTGSALANDATARDQIERIDQIAHDVSVFCINAHARRIYTEAYAFSRRSTSSHQLAELGGVVKSRLLDDLDIAVVPVTASQARKVLLQQLPRKDSKAFTIRNVRRLGGIASKWTEDECDAFTICNLALMHEGGTAMSFPGE
jgi:hypothetical protein